MQTMSVVKFLTVFLFIIPSVISSICDLQKGNGDNYMRWFNPIHMICCGQRLSQRTENIDCCGGKDIYYSNVQICCNGTVSDKRIPRQNHSKEIDCRSEYEDCIEKMCCGNKLVSKDENTFCCDGNRVDLKETDVSNRDFFYCCGDKVIDVREQMCCSKTPVQRNEAIGCCNNEVYLKKQYKCVQNRKMVTTMNLCGQKQYDALKDSCCDEQLVENEPELIEKETGVYVQNPNAECCGVNVIGKDKKCCEKYRTGFPAHGIANDIYLECCGPGSYNTKTQFCLNGTPVNKSPNQTLCGKQIIDTTFQKCCANRLPYNDSHQECCDGARYCVINKGEGCCNGFKMKENELCCEMRKPCQKRNPNHDGCCYDYERDNGQTFISKNEKCQNGQIFHVPDHMLPCGLGDFYNPDDQFCCSGKKYQKINGQCCHGIYSSIPPTEGKCCDVDGRMYKLDDTSNPCLLRCNRKDLYDPDYELCCEERKFKYSGKNYCCGPFAIDSHKKGCCGGKLPFHIRPHKKCCWSKQVYNERHSRCLQTGEVEPKRRKLLDAQKLCYPLYVRSFDGGIQQACRRDIAIRGKVVNIETIRNTGDDYKILISMTKVKILKGQKDFDSKSTASENLTFVVHISPDVDCPVTHLKQLRKVIVLFDLPSEGIQENTVNITKNSPFFLTRHTVLRRYAITKVATENHCKVFS